MIFDLVKDFSGALAAMPGDHPKRRMLELLEEAIRRDVHFIARHPTTLFQCMWNTCWWYDCPRGMKPRGICCAGAWLGWSRRVFRKILKTTSAFGKGVHWDDTSPKLSGLLEVWRTGIKEVRPEFTWIRSQLSPALPLGVGQVAVFRGHEDSVRCVQYSPGGERIATGSDDGSVRIWDAWTGRQLCCLETNGSSARSLSFSPSGCLLTAGYNDGTVRVWDTVSGGEVNCIQGDYASVFCATWEADDKCKAAIAGYDGRLRIVDTFTGQEVGRLHVDQSWFRGAVFSPNGLWLATCSDDRMLRIWEMPSGSERYHLQAPSFSQSAVSFVADGPAIVIAWLDLHPAVSCWDPISGKERRCFKENTIVTSIIVSGDGRMVALGLHDGTVHISDLLNGTRSCYFRGHEERVNGVAFSPDGGQVATVSDDCTVRILSVTDVAGPGSAREYGQNVGSIIFSGDGSRLFFGSKGRGVEVMDAENWLPLRCLQDPFLRAAGASCFEEDGISCTPSGHRVAAIIGRSYSVLVWDAQTGAFLTNKSFTEPERVTVKAANTGETLGSTTRIVPVTCSGFNCDGSLLGVGMENGHVYVLDATAGRTVCDLVPYKHPVLSIGISHDGRYGVSTYSDGTVLLWDAGGGQVVRMRDGNDDEIHSISFTPDGNRIVGVSRRGRAAAWKVGTGVRVSIEDNYSWQAESYNGETRLKCRQSPDVLASFPGVLWQRSTHPSGRTWAGTIGNHLCVITLEGGGLSRHCESAGKLA